MSATRSAHAVLAALCLLLMVGCAIDFETPSEVIDLRTLAIQADPPEILLGSGPAEVLVDALVVDPRGPDREVTARWRACGTTTERRCDEAAFVADLGSGAATLPTVRATVPITAELIEAARRADLLQGFGGFVLYAELTLDEGEPDEEVAFKQIVVQPALPDGTTPNQNPSVPGLLRDDAPWAEDEVPVVAPGDEVAIEPTAPEGDAESYSVFRFDLQTEDLTEYLGYRFFATAGTWNREQTGGQPNAIATETTLASRWTAPEEPPEDGEPVRLWVVARDGRGGLSWTERRIEVR